MASEIHRTFRRFDNQVLIKTSYRAFLSSRLHPKRAKGASSNARVPRLAGPPSRALQIPPPSSASSSAAEMFSTIAVVATAIGVGVGVEVGSTVGVGVGVGVRVG